MWYTVVIFTASMQEYADPVIDWLDQGRGLIGGRLFREVSQLSLARRSSKKPGVDERVVVHCSLARTRTDHTSRT